MKNLKKFLINVIRSFTWANTIQTSIWPQFWKESRASSCEFPVTSLSRIGYLVGGGSHTWMEPFNFLDIGSRYSWFWIKEVNANLELQDPWAGTMIIKTSLMDWGCLHYGHKSKKDVREAREENYLRVWTTKQHSTKPRRTERKDGRG